MIRFWIWIGQIRFAGVHKLSTGLSLDEALDIIGPIDFTFSSSPRRAITGHAEHRGDILWCEQLCFFAAVHSCMVICEIVCRSVASIERNGGSDGTVPAMQVYLLYETELLETPALYKCTACGWMVCDPNFRKEQLRYFPPDSVDKRSNGNGRIWAMTCTRQEARLVSLESVRVTSKMLSETTRLRRSSWAGGLIACNTPALQVWWDAKNHHR
jgi:hypothetical protein